MASPPPPSSVGRAHQLCRIHACWWGWRSAAQELGDLEREVEGLPGVQAGVAARLVALLEVVAEHLVAPAQALGDVLAGELDVHATGPHVGVVTGPEEPVQLAHDAVELARLV